MNEDTLFGAVDVWVLASKGVDADVLPHLAILAVSGTDHLERLAITLIRTRHGRLDGHQDRPAH
jgi:hypothetical protein